MVNDSSEQSSRTEYDSHFFKAIQKGSYQSAQEIVPLILNGISPQSIVDVGCGDGTWLSVPRDCHKILYEESEPSS